MSGYDSNDLPYYAKNIDSSYTLIYEEKELNISIYKLDTIKLPHLSEAYIFHSFNGFESNIDNWIQNEENISTFMKYEGDASYKMNEYSSSFKYNMDSLSIWDFSSIIINCQVYCNVLQETDAKIIISMENEEGIYSRHELYINKYIKAYSSWWYIKYDIALSTQDIENSSTLKIYVCKNDKSEVYIDNFNVKIVGLKN